MLSLVTVIIFAIFLIIIFPSQGVFSEERIIKIPSGAFNPNLDTPALEWYSPTFKKIQVGDTVTWVNDDQEGHTVTSGKGSGRFGWMQKDFGTSDGRFDSERFMPGESWQHTFNEKGTFQYYCKIHPWMEGVIIVGEDIPDYPHDMFGNKITKFPIVEHTKNREYETDLTWEPAILKTKEKSIFVFQFYDPATFKNLPNIKYDFVIEQNGSEIYRSPGSTQIGGDFRNYVFDNSGPIVIRFENVEGTKLFTEFSTIVYDSPESQKSEIVIEPARNIGLSQELLSILIVTPIGLVIFIFVWYYRTKLFTKK